MEPHGLTLNDSSRRGGGNPLRRTQQQRSLLLWSGGVDSTYALVRLLRTTNDLIFTHHVRTLGLSAARCEFEHAAIMRLRARLSREERDFTHTGSSLDLSELQGRGIDSSILAFMAAQAAMTHSLTPFDRILVGVNGDRDPGWDPDTAACALRRSRMARALRAAWGCDEVPQIYLWLPRPHRAQMTEVLGAGLLALTASCAQPVRAYCSTAETDVGGHDRDAAAAGPPNNLHSVLRACGHCAKCRLSSAEGRDASEPQAQGFSGDAGHGAVTRTPHLFHHLEQLSNKKQALRRAAATSDPLAP